MHPSDNLLIMAATSNGIYRTTDGGANWSDLGPNITAGGYTGTIVPGSGKRLGANLTGLDTPTLHGLWSSAPYLHDGSAPTLAAVLRDRNAAGRHGSTAGLTAQQLDDLLAYLLLVRLAVARWALGRVERGAEAGSVRAPSSRRRRPARARLALSAERSSRASWCIASIRP